MILVCGAFLLLVSLIRVWIVPTHFARGAELSRAALGAAMMIYPLVPGSGSILLAVYLVFALIGLLIFRFGLQGQVSERE